MKKTYGYIGSVAAILLATHIGSYQLGKHHMGLATKDNQIAYIDDSKGKAKAPKTNKTMDQISAEEGISAEQIVVKITDQGYVTSHGDHYHFYNGKVPYDAIISEELLMTDPNYRFKQSDVINEILDGYVIKVNGNYYVYLKPGSKRKNIRTKQQIAEQVAKGTKEAKEKGLAQVAHLSKEEVAAVNEAKRQGRYTTDDGYIFSPTDIIDDLGDAYLVPHGNHYHYIPKKDLSPSELAAAQAYWSQKQGRGARPSDYRPTPAPGRRKAPIPDVTPNPGQGHQPDNGGYHPAPPRPNDASQNKHQRDEFKGKTFKELLDQLHRLDLKYRHVEEDGLIFEPTQVIKSNAFGYVVPHGDHYHIIPRSQLSPLEMELADRYLAGQTEDNDSGSDHSKPSDKEVTHTFLGHRIKAYGKGLDGKPYDTSDAYVFSKESIHSVDKSGVTAKHGDHFHYIGFGELEQYELDEVANWVKAKGQADGLAAALDQEQGKEKPLFDTKKVSRKVTKDGKVGYMMPKDGKDYFYARDQLDLTQIAFAEQELMLKDKKHYRYDIVDTGIEPRLAVDVSSLPMHAGNATYDTGSSFVIPHIDHIHVVPYSWLTRDQIATIKYVMQHPEVRPDVWSKPGHEESGSVIPNVTPLDKRAGMPNWQIIHSAEEVQKALAEGRFATPDGYIFDPRDVLAKETFVWKDGSFSIPRADGSSLRTINKSDLSQAEWQQAQELLAKKNAGDATDTDKPKEKQQADKSNENQQPSEASKEEEKESDDFIDSLPDYGLDRATLEDHINQLAQKANIDPKYLIFQPEGVQFYNKNGELVTYDIKTLQQINP
ncbi:TPA: pneumococcal-type histidine triad protein [Streptococcus pyogenes]|nr:pneumococcal-type histidine triad protein [Streptococcus pyogenes]HER1665014.1 pneumococcal-type histidine triad protein [Streptococcus pyogenes]HES3831130.1 pneumococcal-type histidine triad protein [Streptococcus pyogenes]HES4107398.1 pneumococcal-type histidine triad protein [Streptococcus pyogenes]